MHKRVRSGIFLVFLTVFIIGAPMIVFYTAGYRINLNTWRVQRTGVIAITTFPRGASVIVNGKLLAEKTPYVAQRLAPGEYDMLLEKEGYRSWSQRVTVHSGSTAYITAFLFSDTKPELLLEENALSVVGDKNGRFIYLLVDQSSTEENDRSIWRYDTITRLQKKLSENVGDAISKIALNSDDSTLLLHSGNTIPSFPTGGISVGSGIALSITELARATNALPEYSFLNNGSNVEIRLTSTNELVTLLPPDEYSIVLRDNTIAILTDSRNRTYLLNLSTNDVSQIDLPTAILSASPTEQLLAATDGNEIDIYNPQTGERTFITRQSDPVLTLAWHSSERALLFATATTILAIERTKEESRETTVIVDNATIINMWPDTSGKSLTFLGTVNGITGIWKVALTQ